MTNLEYIRTCTKEELAVLLCEMHTYCTLCVANSYCYNGHTGLYEIVEQEGEIYTMRERRNNEKN